MAPVDGVVVREKMPAPLRDDDGAPRACAYALVHALAGIHAFDWKNGGLADFGKPDGYLERQVPRWLAQLDSYNGRDLPAARELAAWLESNLPPEQPPALFHGDYKADNVLFAEDSPPQLLAIVDWEMASIGDPLVDVAWAMIFHPVPGKPMSLGTGGEHAFDLSRVPPADELLARYEAQSGRNLSAMRWYDVFARWKLAIALEGSYAKWQRGESTKPIHEYFGPQADALLTDAQRYV
jgi:aminoglycoside phosphotransferase (APT) family kinase protein